MIYEIETALTLLLDRRDLSAEAMSAAVGAIMDGRAGEVEIAAFLTALRMKGEAVSELVGAAQAMAERATRIVSRHTGLLDTCGTGGDGLHTFNISTATALVTAAAGVPVAKHGNRSASSRSGSADVLEALGVNVQLSPERVGACLDEVGIGFCFAPLVHGAMKYAAPVRKQLGFRTVFNMLGPLTNPAGAAFQLVGVPSCDAAEKMAGALSGLNRRRAIVVCGGGVLDEVSLWGETHVLRVEGAKVTREVWSAGTFDLPPCGVEDLRVESPAESAAVIRRVLGGERGPARDMVLANAAAALLAAGFSDEPHRAVAAAAAAIDSGAAAAICRRLAEVTNA